MMKILLQESYLLEKSRPDSSRSLLKRFRHTVPIYSILIGRAWIS
jgi:hypothetical protein